jgi:hypothetical protein
MRTLCFWIVEYSLILIHFPTYFLQLFISLKGVNPNPTKKHPIILVERWFETNVLHFFGKKYLEKKGFLVYSLNYPIMKCTFEDASQNLGKFIEQHHLQDVILVGISAGATTCLYYLQNENGWSKTYKFISVAGSIKGSPLANFFPFSKSFRQLSPASAFMTNLHSLPILNKDKIITFTPLSDNMVPVKYARLNGVKNITFKTVGHNLFHTLWIPTYKYIAKVSNDQS